MRLLAGKLAALAATVVLAPSLTFVVFTMLSAERLDPGATLTALGDFLSAALLRLDLGYSDYYDRPVTSVLLAGLPIDLAMLVGGLGFGLPAGVAGGLLAVAQPGTTMVRALQVLSGFALSVPVYWLGFVVLMCFSGGSGLVLQVPFVSGLSDYRSLPDDPLRFVQSLWVPCVVVGAPITAGVFRMSASAMRETLGDEYVRTARAKGLRGRAVLLRHVLPVAGLPVLVLASSQVNLLITNIALMQTAFNIPGSFRELTRAYANADLVLIQGMIVESCVIIAIANTAVDLLQARVDPRVAR